jgi:hypothetical protein
MELTGYGITTTLLPGWEGRIMKRAEPELGQANGPDPRLVTPPPADPPPPGSGGLAANGGDTALPERTYPIVHLANFALPDDRGDFGSGAVELMRDHNLFIALFEYGPESVGQPMFDTQGLPRSLRPEQFAPNALQRTISGQSGLQVFFTEGNRAFCLFVALGSHANRVRLVKQANEALASLTIEPR